MSTAVDAQQFVAHGLDLPEAQSLAARVNAALKREPDEAWREVSKDVLRPEHPFGLHLLLFEALYGNWKAEDSLAPAWAPTRVETDRTNVGRMMRERGLASVAKLHAWSIDDRPAFWRHMIDRLGIRLARPFTSVLDLAGGVERPVWLSGAKLNIAESCFGAEPAKTAIIYHDETGRVETVTYGELESLARRVANGLAQAGFRRGDAVAIYLPMNIESVVIYLGILLAGCVVVSIADSLAPEEIATRLRLSAARGVFTQEVLLRGGKQLPLYEKIVEAGAPRAIVIAAGGRAKRRPGDVAWHDFLPTTDSFDTYLADPHEHTNILFSSGTTGEPKAIPWTHVTPIKCAVDAYLHQDVQSDDRLAWPTNLGWMMGPWLIYASLVHRATMCLYGGAPHGRGFGQFVESAGVTMLGVIPSLVKTWRATDCMRGLDWSTVRRFSSTGECSNAEDMLYLMSLAGYPPVIEYCGGTELGGGYIGSTMAQPNVPAAFSTPSFGVELVMDGEDDSQAEAGEVYLVGPAIGMSTELMHHDHHAVYFEGAPRGPQGKILRRHGDALVRLAGGYFRAQGRVDDTMNLGGIKVSSVEIERVLNGVAGIRETAAVAVSPPGGGPSLLWIFAVPRSESGEGPGDLRAWLQDALRRHLNPLFKIHELSIVDTLPRTASHKVMRRLLRDEAVRSLAGRCGL